MPSQLAEDKFPQVLDQWVRRPHHRNLYLQRYAVAATRVFELGCLLQLHPVPSQCPLDRGRRPRWADASLKASTATGCTSKHGCRRRDPAADVKPPASSGREFDGYTGWQVSARRRRSSAWCSLPSEVLRKVHLDPMEIGVFQETGGPLDRTRFAAFPQQIGEAAGGTECASTATRSGPVP